jgi:TM2 domain-containing membrane protein YozV
MTYLQTISAVDFLLIKYYKDVLKGEEKNSKKNDVLGSLLSSGTLNKKKEK